MFAEMEITPKLAFAELRDVSKHWQSIGSHLDADNLRLYIIRSNYHYDDERCLDIMLKDWLMNGRNPS